MEVTGETSLFLFSYSFTPVAVGQSVEGIAAHGVADQPQGGEADVGGHPAHRGCVPRRA